MEYISKITQLQISDYTIFFALFAIVLFITFFKFRVLQKILMAIMPSFFIYSMIYNGYSTYFKDYSYASPAILTSTIVISLLAFRKMSFNYFQSSLLAKILGSLALSGFVAVYFIITTDPYFRGVLFSEQARTVILDVHFVLTSYVLSVFTFIAL